MIPSPSIKFLLPVFLLLAFACKKKDNAIPALQISDMPVKTGDSWSYAVTNYPPTNTDTAVFQIGILDPSLISNVYKTQTTIGGTVVDSGIVNSTTSARTYLADNGAQTFAGSGLFNGWVLNFPISAQSSWSVSGATVKVIATAASLTIGGNNYSNVYTLLRTVITPAGPVNDTMLLAPQVGIVKWDGFPLVSYHLQ